MEQNKRTTLCGLQGRSKSGCYLAIIRRDIECSFPRLVFYQGVGPPLQQKRRSALVGSCSCEVQRRIPLAVFRVQQLVDHSPLLGRPVTALEMRQHFCHQACMPPATLACRTQVKEWPQRHHASLHEATRSVTRHTTTHHLAVAKWRGDIPLLSTAVINPTLTCWFAASPCPPVHGRRHAHITSFRSEVWAEPDAPSLRVPSSPGTRALVRPSCPASGAAPSSGVCSGWDPVASCSNSAFMTSILGVHSSFRHDAAK